MGDEFKDANVDEPLLEIRGGKAFGPNGQRYWWPDFEVGKPLDDDQAARLLGPEWTDLGYIDETTEWFKPVTLNQPVTLNLEASGVSSEAISILFGFDGSKTDAEPTHAVVIDTTDIVSGAPPYPHIGQDLVLELPWWRFLERRRRIAERERLVREWERTYANWIAEGRPDREVLIRRFIPNAHIEVVDGD